jgi:hypothetical protein
MVNLLIAFISGLKQIRIKISKIQFYGNILAQKGFLSKWWLAISEENI